MIEFDDTEQALRDSLRRWLADHTDAALQGRADLPPSAPVWGALARELGLLGAGLPEAVGGLGVGPGGGLRTQLLVLQTLGEALAAEPYLSSALVGAAALQAAGTPAALALLGGVIEGTQLLALAWHEPGGRGGDEPPACQLQRAPGGAGWRLTGRKSGVVAAGVATQLLVSASGEQGPVLVCVPAGAAGIGVRMVRTLDGGSAGELQFDGVALGADAVLGGPELLAELQDRATLGACAEALGVTQRLLADTLEHLQTRRQFGQPLAAFQVLQHRVADMHIARLQAEALTWAVAAGYEAASARESAHERALAVSSAKVATGRACRVVGQGAMQLFGAMGVTEELAAGRWARRALQIELGFGDSRRHLRRIDRLLVAGAH